MRPNGCGASSSPHGAPRPTITVAHSREAHFRVEQSTKSSRRAHLFPGSLARHPAPKKKLDHAHHGQRPTSVPATQPTLPQVSSTRVSHAGGELIRANQRRLSPSRARATVMLRLELQRRLVPPARREVVAVQQGLPSRARTSNAASAAPRPASSAIPVQGQEAERPAVERDGRNQPADEPSLTHQAVLPSRPRRTVREPAVGGPRVDARQRRPRPLV